MRTAIYARVSTVTHSPQHTLEEQINRLRARLLSRGEAVADEHIFRDDGYERRHPQAAPASTASATRRPWPPSTRSSSPTPTGWPATIVHQALLLEELQRQAAASSSSTARCPATRTTSSCSRSAGPSPSTSGR